MNGNDWICWMICKTFEERPLMTSRANRKGGEGMNEVEEMEETEGKEDERDEKLGDMMDDG